MKAIILRNPGDFVIDEIDRPEVGPDEVLIRVIRSGICTNDVRDFNGDCSYTYPRIGGHEYAGVIEEIGSDVNRKRFAPGLPVVTYIIDDCKECYYCKSGQENLCEEVPASKTFQNPDGLSGYGGFAEYVVSKANDLFIYPEGTSFDAMAYTEPLACVLNSINRTDIEFGDDVVVIGGGAMGLLHVMAARLRGANVIMSEPLAQRREKSLELGASEVIDPVNEDPVEKLKSLTQGRGASVVFDTTAIPAVAAQAVDMTAPGGTCVMFSSIHPNVPVPVDLGAVHSHQKTITGAVSPTIKSFHQSVRMLAAGLIDPSPLTEAVYDYTDFGEAIERASKAECYKVLLAFGDE